MNSDQALTGLAAIVGGGGVSSALVAFFAYLTEARKGRKPSDGNVAITIGNELGRGRWDEATASSLSVIAFCLTRLVAITEIKAEQDIKDGGFHDRLETKITPHHGRCDSLGDGSADDEGLSTGMRAGRKRSSGAVRPARGLPSTGRIGSRAKATIAHR